MSEIAELSDFFKYPSGIIAVELWEVDDEDNPCDSTRTKKNGFLDTEEEIYYEDFNEKITLNGRFFPEDSTREMYFDIVNGKQHINVTFTCNNSTNIYYDDMPQPEHYDVYNQYLLAVYPTYQIVVKYDLRQGTNPVGEIIAGHWGKAKNKRTDNIEYLCLPEMVVWRDDGERFAVYSGGLMKSISFYTKDGTLLRNLQSLGVSIGDYGVIPTPMRYTYDNEEYPEDINLTDLEGKPSFVGDLTVTDINEVDKTYVVTKLEYVTNGGNPLIYTGYEALYVGMYYRGEDRSHSYKIWAIVPYNASLEHDMSVIPYWMHNFAELYYEPGEGEPRDMIPDFAVTRKEEESRSWTNYLYLVYPFSFGFELKRTAMKNFISKEYEFKYYTGEVRSTGSVRDTERNRLDIGIPSANTINQHHVSVEVIKKNDAVHVLSKNKQASGVRNWYLKTLKLIEDIQLITSPEKLIIFLVEKTISASGDANYEGYNTFIFDAIKENTLGPPIKTNEYHLPTLSTRVLHSIYKYYQTKRNRIRYGGLNSRVHNMKNDIIIETNSDTEYDQVAMEGRVYGEEDGIKATLFRVDRAETAELIYGINNDGSIEKTYWSGASSPIQVLKEVKQIHQ